MSELPEPFRSQRDSWRRRLWSAAARWLALYVVLAVAPLVLLLLGTAPSSRGFWIEWGVALGIVAFTTLVLQFAVTARFRRIAPAYGSDAQLLFHRVAGYVAFALVVGHPLVLILADSKYLEYFDPRVNPLRTIFLIAALIALVALIVLSQWREFFRLNYEWWRLTHGILALGVVLVGLAHALMVNHYIDGIWKQGLWVLIGLSAVGLLGYVRIVKPWRLKQQPYRVVEVREERGQVWTLIIEPVDHEGIKFRGGQYVWLTLQESPFSLQQHPFSLASSAMHPERLEITSKELGDFTESLQHVKAGTRCFLEGPYGAFTIEGQVADGAVFIMGGIGITPAMSILRTARDRNDQRPMLLMYANRSWEEIAFRDELEELQQQLNLRVVHVLSDPHEGWEGESGYVTAEVLDRHLPRDPTRTYHYYVCGPTPMMNMVEQELAERGVPLLSRSVEHFDMV
jgi:predicted ferric reductase